MTLLSFYGDPAIKEKYLERVRAHRIADNIIQKQTWHNGKGCAVGCTLESYDHSRYPIELGIPTWIAHLKDRLFEEMSEKKSNRFPEKFLEAIPVGVDLEQIKLPFLIYIVNFVINKFDHEKYPKVYSAVKNVLDLLKNKNSSKEDFKRAALSSVISYAADAAGYAAYTAYTTAYAAADIAHASYISSASYVAYAAGYEEREPTYEKFANKLLKLFKQSK